MEALNLNRIPVGSNPVVHVSQYDVGRTFRFNLFEGSEVYTLDGTETIECNVRKLDGNVVTVGVTNTSDNYIDVVTTEQMTAIHGQNYGEIVFRKGGNVIGSVNFILQVEQSPLEGGITSDSAIYNLEVQVANYVAIEVASQYDSANVIFDNTPTSGHNTPYTVTSDGIKTSLDTKQDNITTKTASGDLITITDGGDNIPLKSCEVTIEPDLSGHTECNLVVCGKNLVCDKIDTSTILTDGSIASPDNNHDMFLAEIKQGVTYTIKSDENTSPSRQFVGAFFTSKPTIGSVSYSGTRLADVSATFTAPITGWVAFRTSHDYAYAQCEVGNEQTTYEAYNGTTYNIPFGQTVTTGGTLDVITGVLTVGGVDTQLTPISPKTISGVNNIYNDCGSTEIEYFPNSVDGLVTLINNFTVKNATELPISDSDPTDTKSYIDTGLGAKQNANVLNIVKHYDSGTSSDALTDLITTYGAVNMVFAFDVPLGYFTGCLTFANDNMGSGFIVLSTTGRFWVVSYVSGTITLTELT